MTIKQSMSRFSGKMSRFVQAQSPVVQPILLGYLQCYNTFYHWCFYRHIPRIGYMITSEMSRK